MKSTQDNFRVLNYDGKQYRFHYVAFGDLLAEKVAESKKEGKRLSQSALMMKISERSDISPEAVKNWKRGYNGPKDIDTIQKCADVLGVDVLCLLRPLEKIQEAEKMNEREQEVIEEVFHNCMDAVYAFAERSKDYAQDPKSNQRLEHEAEAQFARSIEENHRTVDKAALRIGDSVRYRLHRLLIDLSEISFCAPIPSRWEKIEESVGNDVDDVNLRFYYGCHRRESVKDNVWYFADEQELAEKMNYSYTPIPERFFDSVDADGVPMDEKGEPIPMEKFGITDACNFEITPIILYKDMMTRLLKDVFLHDFPGLAIGTN